MPVSMSREAARCRNSYCNAHAHVASRFYRRKHNPDGTGIILGRIHTVSGIFHSATTAPDGPPGSVASMTLQQGLYWQE